MSAVTAEATVKLLPSDLIEDGTRVVVEITKRVGQITIPVLTIGPYRSMTFADHFPNRRRAKDWAIDVLTAHSDHTFVEAKKIVDEAGCNCDGPTHSRLCWWVVNNDDGREQDA